MYTVAFSVKENSFGQLPLSRRKEKLDWLCVIKEVLLLAHGAHVKHNNNFRLVLQKNNTVYTEIYLQRCATGHNPHEKEKEIKRKFF